MKRKIAAALSIIMVGCSYAAPLVNAADVTVDGSGDVAYVDDSVLTVVVPTSAALDFTIDPQGLVHMADAGLDNAQKSDLDQYSGRILGNNALIFANKSLKDVTVSTTFKVTAGADNLADDADDADDVKDDSSAAKANLIFMAVPNARSIDLNYATTELEANNADLAEIDDFTANDFSGIAAPKGFRFNATGTEVKSVIAAADHKFINKDGEFSYELDNSSVNRAAGFVIAGYCNPFYTDYANLGDVKVSATYSFDAATTAEKDADKAANSFAVISPADDAANAAIDAPHEVVTSSTVSSVKLTASIESGVIKIVAPEGVALAASPVMASYKGADTNIASWSDAKKPKLSADKTTLTIPKATVDAPLDKEADGSYKITVVTASGKEYTVKVK